MSPGIRRSLTLGAASVIAATALMTGTAIAQDEVPPGGTMRSADVKGASTHQE